MGIQTIISRLAIASKNRLNSRNAAGRRMPTRRLSLLLEAFETRQLLTLPPTLTIPLLPDLDQFGDQILIVQGFGVPERAALGIFDTGASAVTFAATDQEVFAGIEEGPIPIKVPGGAAAGGIGGEIVGDVSEPGTIYSDGMHAFDLSFDDFGFPQFNISLSPSALETPGIQAFVGTDSSPLLPTITGTPALQASLKYPNGAAAHVSMQGAKIDFSDIFPDLIIPFPDLNYALPGTTITYDTTDTTLYDPVTLPLIPFGGDNFADPGDLITETNLYLIPGVTSVMDTTTSSPGDFLFDTGAQLSVISTDMALSLGLDLDNPTTSIDVQGVAGNETVPGFTISKLIFPRADGGTLEFTDVPVYVLDVAPGIGGIFGMNLMNVANQFVFDPHNANGPQLSIQYFSNPDRGSGDTGDIGGELAALLGGSLGAMFGSLGGKHIPSFPNNSSTLASNTTMVVPSSPVEYGASFSISTKVAGQPNSPVPSGKINLYNGNTSFASQDLNAKGEAKWSSPSTPWEVGSYHVKATYSGDAKYGSSTSTTNSFQIVKAATNLVIQAASTQVNIGGQFQLTGKLTSSTGVSTSGSTINILIDGKQAASATTAADGTFTAAIPAGAVGSHTIQAVYAGSNHFKTASSGSLSVQVNKFNSSIALTIPTTSVEYGSTLSIKATVTGPTGSPTATGSVDFSTGSGKFATVSLNTGATANWESPAEPWPVGSYTINAAYGGDAQFGGSSAPAATIQVVKAGTSLTLAATSSLLAYGDSIQLSGKLSSSTGVATTGSVVKILLDGKQISTATTAADGSFSLALPGGLPGSHSIQASYDGSATFNSSSSQAVAYNLAKATGELSLSVPAKLVFGQNAQIVATLKAAAADAFRGATVVFYDGTKELGRSIINNGTASILLPAVQVGKNYQLSATILESSNSQKAITATSSVVVNKADTTVRWTALPPPRKGRPSPGWTIKITPNSPGGGVPTGSVTITLANKKARPKIVNLVNGSAVYKFTGTANKPVKISFGGNSNFNSTQLII